MGICKKCGETIQCHWLQHIIQECKVVFANEYRREMRQLLRQKTAAADMRAILNSDDDSNSDSNADNADNVDNNADVDDLSHPV